MEKWSKEKAWEWYDSHPWLRGMNYLPSNCVNRIEAWQEYGFEETEQVIERELALAKETGFNTVRIIPPFEVWDQEHDSYMERLEKFLQICSKYGISVMYVFENDCTVPKEMYEKPILGRPQPVDWGYHGGVKRSPHMVLPDEPGVSELDTPEGAAAVYRMVDEIVGKYKDDPRIVVWDLFNEPGHSNRGKLTMPHLIKMFEIARSHNPAAPITTGAWMWNSTDPDQLPEIELTALELSDIVTLHSYTPFPTTIEILDKTRAKYGRPMMITEWFCRCGNNNLADHFPMFYYNKIGCYNWGFVAGKSQTYEPHESIWKRIEEGEEYAFDVTKWFHDLYRPSFRPYDPKEIKIIRQFTQLADAKWERESAARERR